MTAEDYDPRIDIGHLVTAALDFDVTSAAAYAGRLAEHLHIGHADGPQMVAKALGIPAPRAVVYDMGKKVRYDVLTGTLEMFAKDQQNKAKTEPGNPRHHEAAALAKQMMHQADTARHAGGQEAYGG